jgi:hypothetical protein
MSNKLKQITTKAKALYKSGKYKKWTDAIKAASKQVTKIGDYSVNKSDFIETRIPVTPRKKRTKKEKKFEVTRNIDGTYKRGGIKKISGLKTHTDEKSHNVNVTVGALNSSKKSHLNLLTNYYGKLSAKLITATKAKEKKDLKKQLLIIKREISKLRYEY